MRSISDQKIHKALAIVFDTLELNFNSNSSKRYASKQTLRRKAMSKLHPNKHRTESNKYTRLLQNAQFNNDKIHREYLMVNRSPQSAFLLQVYIDFEMYKLNGDKSKFTNKFKRYIRDGKIGSNGLMSVTKLKSIFREFQMSNDLNEYYNNYNNEEVRRRRVAREREQAARRAANKTIGGNNNRTPRERRANDNARREQAARRAANQENKEVRRRAQESMNRLKKEEEKRKLKSYKRHTKKELTKQISSKENRIKIFVKIDNANTYNEIDKIKKEILSNVIFNTNVPLNNVLKKRFENAKARGNYINLTKNLTKNNINKLKSEMNRLSANARAKIEATRKAARKTKEIKNKIRRAAPNRKIRDTEKAKARYLGNGAERLWKTKTFTNYLGTLANILRNSPPNLFVTWRDARILYGFTHSHIIDLIRSRLTEINNDSEETKNIYKWMKNQKYFGKSDVKFMKERVKSLKNYRAARNKK